MGCKGGMYAVMSLDQQRGLGRWLGIAVICALALYLHGVIYLITDSSGDAFMTFSMATTVGFAAPVMPFIAALPFATAFCEDIKSGYFALIVSRVSAGRYLRSKVIACMLSGGLASALGLMLFIITINVKFPPGVDVFMGHFVFYLTRIFLAFLSGAFWAMTAMLFSAFFPNVELSLCVPLVTYRLLAELAWWMYIPAQFNVTLMDVGMVDLSDPMLMLHGIMLFGGLSAVCATGFYLRALRRVRYA